MVKIPINYPMTGGFFFKKELFFLVEVIIFLCNYLLINRSLAHVKWSTDTFKLLFLYFWTEVKPHSGNVNSLF